MRIGVIAVLLLCLAARTVHAGTVQLPKTGQIVSYYAADDGALQKGVAVSGARFIDNGNGTITDNLTGLIWLKDANCYDTQTWDAALNDAKILSSGRCGLTDGSKAGDWRLPNVDELESLLDLANYNPALPAGNPFANLPIVLSATGSTITYFWTSTTDVLHPGYAWTIDLYSGIIFQYDKSLPLYNVWPVRNLPPVQYLLTSTKAGAGSGTVTSDPVGISCTGTCSAKFDEATEVTLVPTESFGSFFESWSGGGCSGNGSCLVTMNGATSVTATFSIHPPVNLDTAYYPLISDAYEKAISGAAINIQAVDLTESPVFNKSKDITLKGGFDGKFASNKGYISSLSGVMRISSGTVRVENMVIR